MKEKRDISEARERSAFFQIEQLGPIASIVVDNRSDVK